MRQGQEVGAGDEAKIRSCGRARGRRLGRGKGCELGQSQRVGAGTWVRGRSHAEANVGAGIGLG